METGAAARHAIFLYEHLGATPFDAVTSGRYWMAGLIACGFVMIGYTAAIWVARRPLATYRPPPWEHVWAVASLPLVIGIPLITMRSNQPVLPPLLTVACTVAALVGLAFALSFASLVVNSGPGAVLLDGIVLVPLLLAFRTLELPGRAGPLSSR